jgi:WD40 repeat protein
MDSEIDHPEHSYDAFISYSRKDIAFARKLEQALRNYRPPKNLPVPQRNLRVFRDEADFTGAEYHESLDRHLKEAGVLIVICSPNAAASQYVADEIRRFAEHRGKEHIVPILLDGNPNNEVGDGNGGRCAFPQQLVDLLPTPLAADYRGFNPKRDNVRKGMFASAWFKTIADIYSDYAVDRAKVEGRERQREVRRLRNIAAISSSVAVALIGLTAWALVSRNEARRQRDAAEARQNETEARLVFDASSEGLVNATLHAIESVRAARTVDGQISIMRFLELLPRPPAWRLSPRQPDANPIIGERQRVLAFSPDGTRIASAGGAGPVLILNAQTGQVIKSLVIDSRSPDRTVLAFSPDGTLLVLGCRHQACVIDVATGRLVTQLPDGTKGHGTMVWSASFSSDGKQLALSSYGSNEVRIYDVGTWQTTATIKAGTNTVFSVRFSGNGQWVVSGSATGLQLWRTGRYDAPAAEVPSTGPVWSVAFTRDENGLVIGSDKVQTWSIEPGDSVKLKSVGSASIRAHTVSPVLWGERDCVAAAAREAVYVLCDPETLTEVLRLPQSSAAMAVSVDGRRLVNQSQDGTRTTWHVDGGLASARIQLGGAVESMASAHSDWIAAGTEQGDIAILGVDTWKERKRLHLPASVSQLTTSADGHWLAAGAGHSVQVFESNQWNTSGTLAFDSDVDRIGFDSSNRWLFVVAGPTVATLQPGDWRERLRVQHDGNVEAVRINRDASRVATVTHWIAGHDHGVQLTRVFDIATGREIGWQFEAGGGSSISRDFMEKEAERQKRALAGGEASVVNDSMSWRGLELREPYERASSDGLWAVERSRSTIQLRDAATSRLLAELEHGGEVAAVHLIPASSPRWVVTAAHDGSVTVWSILTDDLADEACTRLRAALGASSLQAHIAKLHTDRSCSH